MAALRIISLCPSLTETLFALGVGPQIVGRTKYCVEPAGQVEAVPTVGGTKDPDIDRIIELRPTHVFLNEEENRREDAERLFAAGVSLHTSMPRGVDDVPQVIRSVAVAIGQEHRGEEVAAQVEAAAAEVRKRALGLPAVSFVVLIWRKPWMAAGPNTFLSDVLVAAGGVNLLSLSDERYPEIELGEIAQLAPRLVLLPSEPFPFLDRHVDELARGTRFDRARFVRCDGQLLTWHGDRTSAGLRAAERWISAGRP